MTLGGKHTFGTPMVIILVIVNGILWLSWWESYRSYTQVERTVALLRDNIENLKAETLIEKPNPIDIQSLLQQLPTTDDQPSWIRSLYNALESSGITVQEIRFEEVTPDNEQSDSDSDSYLLTNISMEGNWDQFIIAMERLGKQERINHIQSWSITTKGADQLSFYVQLAAFFSPEHGLPLLQTTGR